MLRDSSSKNRIVLGTAGLAGLWGKVDRKESVYTIHLALELGVSHIDTAPAYADAELMVASALREWKGALPFISTKAGKLRSDSADIAMYDYSPKGITQSVEHSLNLFGLDALDLLFLHDPSGMKPEEIAPAVDTLVSLKQRGLIKSVGIGGNFGIDFAPYSVSGVFSHFMGYNRYNLIRQSAAHEEYPELRKNQVGIWQASPLYMGLLGSKYTAYTSQPPGWIPKEDLAKASQLNSELDGLGCDLTGLALNYVYNSPCIDKMVIGASNRKELQSTVDFLASPFLHETAMRFLKRDSIF